MITQDFFIKIHASLVAQWELSVIFKLILEFVLFVTNLATDVMDQDLRTAPYVMKINTFMKINVLIYAQMALSQTPVLSPLQKMAKLQSEITTDITTENKKSIPSKPVKFVTLLVLSAMDQDLIAVPLV